jgi:hypothetical protein
MGGNIINITGVKPSNLDDATVNALKLKLNIPLSSSTENLVVVQSDILIDKISIIEQTEDFVIDDTYHNAYVRCSCGTSGSGGTGGTSGSGGTGGTSGSSGYAVMIGVIPQNSIIPILTGTVVTFSQAGDGTLILSSDSGVTLNAYSGGTGTLGKFSAIQAIKIKENEWDIIGGIRDFAWGYNGILTVGEFDFSEEGEGVGIIYGYGYELCGNIDPYAEPEVNGLYACIWSDGPLPFTDPPTPSNTLGVYAYYETTELIINNVRYTPSYFDGSVTFFYDIVANPFPDEGLTTRIIIVWGQGGGPS